MTDDQSTHVTVTYKDGNNAETTLIYAINETTIQGARDWTILQENPTAGDFQKWLQSKGCPLDCCDAPALLRRHANGMTQAEYYRDGKLHREDGPAVIFKDIDGSTVEKYFRNGKRHREDGPAYIRRYADGTTLKEYYINDSYQRRESNSLFSIPGVSIWLPRRNMRPGPLSPPPGAATVS
jgi:hypothetical protein